MLLSAFLNTLFVIEVLFILSLEKKMWKTYLTPIFFLYIPFLIVWFYALIFSEISGFNQLHSPALIIWIIGIFVFWLPSLIIHLVISKFGFEFALPNLLNVKYIKLKNDRAIVYISIIIALMFLLRLIAFIYYYGLNEIGSDIFGNIYAGSGFWGHLRVFLMPLIIYHIITFKSNWKSKCYILFVYFLVMILYQVKGWIIITVISSVFLKIWLGELKFKLKLVLWIIIFGVTLFFVSYYLSLVTNKNNEFNVVFVIWVFKHFSYYLISGVIGLSEYVKNCFPINLNYQVVIAPIVNIWNHFSGNALVSPINAFDIPIGNGYASNVYTFFGSLYIWSGVYLGLFFSFLFSFLYYFSYLIFLSIRNIWLFIAMFFLMGLLSMGWFEFYLFHLDVLEIPVFCVVMALVFSDINCGLINYRLKT